MRNKPETSPATKNRQDTSSDWVFMTPKKGKKKQEDQKIGYSPDSSSPVYSIEIDNAITLKAFTISTAKYQQLEDSRGEFSPVSPTEERSPLEGTATRNNGSPLTGDTHHFIQAIGTNDERLINWFEHTCNIVTRITKIHTYRESNNVSLSEKEKQCRINHIQALKTEIKAYKKQFKNMKRDQKFYLPLLNTITRQALPSLNSYLSITEDRTLNDPYSVIDGLKKPEKLLLKNKVYFTGNNTAKTNHDSEATSNGNAANIDTATRESTKARSEASTQGFPPLPEIHRVLVPLTLKLIAEDENTPRETGHVAKSSDTRKIRAQHRPSFSDDEENQCPANTGKLSHTRTSKHRAGIFGMQSKGKDRNTSALTSTKEKNMVQSIMAYHPR